MRFEYAKLERLSTSGSYTNYFFQKTGLGRLNDNYAISFIDFYFFTWLSHFGIVNYIEGDETDPVVIELTSHGKLFLNYLI